MENSRVEAIASSLVREYLHRKGLKKTIVVLEEELPRTVQSISNRNELRSVLHLDSLYKENKLQEKPLKTLLEIITKYLLEHLGKIKQTKMSRELNPEPTRMFIKGHQLKDSESAPLIVCEVTDDENGGSTAVSDTSKTQIYRAESSEPIYKTDHPKTSQHKSMKSESSIKPSILSSDRDVKPVIETPKMPETSSDGKNPTSETLRPKSSRIVRGMMSGPIASSQEDSAKKKMQRKSAPISTLIHTKTDGQASDLPRTSTSSPANTALQLGKEFSALVLSASLTCPTTERPVNTKNMFSKQERQSNGTDQAEQRLHMFESDNFNFPSGTGEEKRFGKKNENNPSANRKMLPSNSHKDVNLKEDMKLDDIEDDLIGPDIGTIPAFPSNKIQMEGKPIDLSLAVEIKKILFGSSLCCFSEEWKIQSFTFSPKPQLKYGFVQKKGGPCGVLAAVQACMLKNLLFGKDSDSRILQPSDTHRTVCLCNAVADILWRAGDNEEAVVAVYSRWQQFSPAGRYKADGILEHLILYNFSKYEDLVTFLQLNIGQFEFGPFGCILLTLSVVLSRSIELVQKDFDVPTNYLIGAHAYCTQELVNLILGGRAVSNVFNDVVELDSGNGNFTLLKGIAHRSEIGFLSLFEHYSVCQVGSYLKTPKYPIWVVCSESHFSVLFCLRKELMNDWKMERRFDLYYYDGLANQQEEIRLTIDTAETYDEDSDGDLTPPLEYCIKTKWKGAIIDWNGSEPIL
ncbi:putative ubiquitin carboxyl-terminal hydrolase MINDY-4 [Pelodytes ibericus]